MKELVPIKTLEIVECDNCQIEMKVDSKAPSFFTFYGNVTIGLEGGIIGNSLDEQGKVMRGLIYCFRCTDKILNEAKLFK